MLAASTGNVKRLCSGEVGSGRAVGAGAEDLQGVTEVDVPVLCGDLFRPPFDGRTQNLYGGAALATDEVMMVLFAATTAE